MLILLPIFLLLLTAVTLIAVQMTRPDYRSFWTLAIIGSTVAFVSTLFWRIDFSEILILPGWGPNTIFPSSPAFVADDISWAYATCLTAMCLVVILTARIRSGSRPIPWAGTIFITALGLMSFTAGNPLTIALVWAALDFTELITSIYSARNTPTHRILASFTLRLTAIGLVLWTSLGSSTSGPILEWRSIPTHLSFYLLLAVASRIGVSLIYLPEIERSTGRDFGIMQRLVSAASSIVLLGRIPEAAFTSQAIHLFVFCFVCLMIIIMGWLWLRSNDARSGYPFWQVGLGLIGIATLLRGNPLGGVGWGLVMILLGGFLSLASVSNRIASVMFVISLLSCFGLPYTLTAGGWLQSGDSIDWSFFFIIPGYALLLSGCIRHGFSRGFSSFDNQPGRARFFYITGLTLIPCVSILLGLWGWRGAGLLGSWWWGVIGVILSLVSVWLFPKTQDRISNTFSSIGHWQGSFLIWVKGALEWVYGLLESFFRLLSSALEGEGGILWTLLLLLLLISIIYQGST